MLAGLSKCDKPEDAARLLCERRPSCLPLRSESRQGAALRNYSVISHVSPFFFALAR